MPNVTATQLARGIREPAYRAPGPAAPPPPPFLAKPTTVGRAAVRDLHLSGPGVARAYLSRVLAHELNHTHPSMKSNAENTVQGLENYIVADLADARSFERFGQRIVVNLPSGAVKTTVDVVVRGSDDQLSGRAVFWDGPTASLPQAEVMAYAYARAMQTMFAGEAISDICIWQVRRNNIHQVPLQTALGHAAAADRVLAGL